MVVTVVGCGVRGSVCAALLTGAAIDQVALVDGAFVTADDVGVHPLQFTPDVNASKPDALAAKLGLLNPDVLAEPFPADLTGENALAILSGSDIVVDCAGAAEVSRAIEHAAETLGFEAIAAPEGYAAESVTPAEAVAAGALQASWAIAALSEH